MKTYNKKSLPESVEYKGEVYKLNVDITGAMKANKTPLSTIKDTLKNEGRKMVVVNVMSNNLKGKTDLHGKPYKPSTWVFTTNK